MQKIYQAFISVLILVGGFTLLSYALTKLVMLLLSFDVSRLLILDKLLQASIYMSVLVSSVFAACHMAQYCKPAWKKYGYSLLTCIAAVAFLLSINVRAEWWHGLTVYYSMAAMVGWFLGVRLSSIQKI